MKVAEAFRASKRKQECSNTDTVQQDHKTDVFNTKKQRLSGDLFHGNGGILPYSSVMFDGHGQVNGNQQTNMISTENHELLTNGVISEQLIEDMECTQEINGLSVEMNGNKTTGSANLCPHGHTNTCTTYNVPCRYPRMYCHPGGIMEDRLQVYHGF